MSYFSHAKDLISKFCQHNEWLCGEHLPQCYAACPGMLLSAMRGQGMGWTDAASRIRFIVFCEADSFFADLIDDDTYA